MHTRRFDTLVRLLCALACSLTAALAHAAPARVLVVFGKNVSGEARQALEAALAEAERVDASEYERLARAQGLLPHSDAALERVAPRMQAQLIVVAHKSGAKLVLTYRAGATGQVLRKDSLPERRRGPAAKRFRARVAASVRESLAPLAADSGSTAPPVEPEPLQEPQVEEPAQPEPEPEPEPVLPEQPESEQAPPPARFQVELSSGIAAAQRQATIPTRLGVHELDTGLFTGVALGLGLTATVSDRVLVRASADYRTSLGLRGSEQQRETAMSTPLRSHSVGFGIAPGYRFAAANGVSVLVHLGWYFRGLRPIAQLALPEISWHAAVIRPEVHVPLLDGVLTLRLAPELLLIAGLYTTLPDESGLAHSGTGFGGEASLDVRLAAPLALRVEYRESHASFRSAWAGDLSDVERFAALRVVLIY